MHLAASAGSQVLGDKPNEAVDLLETSLLVKKTAFEAQESAPLVPVLVSVQVLLSIEHSRCISVPML